MKWFNGYGLGITKTLDISVKEQIKGFAHKTKLFISTLNKKNTVMIIFFFIFTWAHEFLDKNKETIINLFCTSELKRRSELQALL